ncbi:carboxypeptidase-like regulatory domain-containing protein [bacterium]|nr:carboxypeptidase-like regulatory domain-containing protein [bacterium]
MKLVRISIVMLITAACAMAQVSAAIPDATPEPTKEQIKVKDYGKIEGVILCETTGKPIQNAYVCVEGCLNAAMTNERGIFCLKGIPSGVCKVKVTKKGFEAFVQEVQIRKNKNLHIDISMKEAQG